MTAVVRVFYHQGLIAAPMSNRGDAPLLLHQPYIGSDMLVCNVAEPVSTTGVNAAPGALLASVEVQPGKAVHCEINPPGRDVMANEGSPLISGKTLYPFGQGWLISVLEATI